MSRVSYSAQEVNSHMAEPDETVQPDEGQGGTATTGGLDLYDLQSVPEELREPLTPILKDIEGNVTRKFQEAADYRKAWEPFDEMGLRDVDPQEVQALLQFREIAADPEQFAAWHQAVGQELQQAAPTPAEEVDPVQAELTALKAQLEQVTGRFQEQDEVSRTQEAAAFVRTTLDSLKTEHGEFNEDAVLKLALAHDGEDAIQKAFADYQQIIGSAQSQLLEKKLDEPDPALSGGSPATAASPITSYEEARKLALGRLRQ